jgi:hypothetical protein
MRPFLLAALLAAATGCEIPDIETPCTGIDCSGHGECRIVQEPSGERARCQCDEGYMTTVEGLDCYAPIHPPVDAGPDAG